MANTITPKLDSLLSDILGSGNTTLTGSVFGGKSSITSLIPGGGLVSGLASSLLGSNFLQSLDGFIKNGFDFTCLGGQAVTTAKVQDVLKRLDEHIKREVATNDPQRIEILANDLAVAIEDGKRTPNNLRSGCSKKLIIELTNRVDGIRSELLSKLPHTSTRGNWTSKYWKTLGNEPNHSPMTFEIELTHIQQSTEIKDLSVSVPQEFISQYGKQINDFALSNGLDPNETIKQAYQKFVSDGGITGNISIGSDGNVDWNVSAGNQPNYTPFYIAAVALLAWKVLKK